MYAQVVRGSFAALLLAVSFGAADQFLGSRAFVLGYWATEASLLSAPWLLVAFFAGWSQPTARRAVTLGLICTFAALCGYWAMTLSPIEGAHVSARGIRSLLISQSLLVAGGLVTGPLFGRLGNRWRKRRDWLSASIVALAVCLEPLAHAVDGSAVRVRGVWAGEVAAGVLMLGYVALRTRRIST